jgi:preprotein translocase subunit SecY
MLQAFLNVFKIAELRTKVLFTLGMLVVYRIGFWIPLPGIDQSRLKDFMETQSQSGGAFGRLADYVSVFSGGALGQSTIFCLGIMPYISAAIIFQLLQSVWPTLKKLKEEGPTGYQKIQEWTRYATVGLCLIQSFAWLSFIRGQGFVYSEWANQPVWWVMGIAALTAGTVFLMWLGEQIDRHGIGNGISLIIMAGILTGMPGAIMWVVQNSDIRTWMVTTMVLGDAADGFEPTMSLMGVMILLAAFVIVVAGSVLMTVAQRRIPIQQAKHTRGRKVYGGQRSYLPLRVNHGGVMPIIFASSLMIFPSVILAQIATTLGAMEGGGAGFAATAVNWFAQQFDIGAFPYMLLEVLLIYFFAYFWITVQFNPEEIAKQLRDHGSFIPGLRPGPRTAEYLEIVMERLTYVGGAFLAVIAAMPLIVMRAMNIPFNVTQFLGGTGLLIVVAVTLDLIQRIEANLLMRNYAGFLGEKSEGGTGKRIRGPR